MCWAGVREAIARGVIGFDAFKHLLLIPILGALHRQFVTV